LERPVAIADSNQECVDHLQDRFFLSRCRHNARRVRRRWRPRQ
jgi:hypothetical protein